MRFWGSDKKFVSFIGGVGSGKSRAGSIKVLSMPKGSRGCILAPNYATLKDATLEVFEEIARPLIVRKTMSPHPAYTLVGDIKIICRSADDPDSLRGPNLGWFWMDEGAEMQEIVFDIMIGRLRRSPSLGWITGTPKGQNWIHRLFVLDDRPNYEMIQCSSRTNVFNPPEFIESLDEKYTKQWHAQEVEGEFVDWVEQPAYEFRRIRNVEKGVFERYSRDIPLDLCVDINVRLLAWAVVQIIDGQPLVLCEIEQQEPATLSGAVNKFREFFPAHPSGVRIFGDASGHSRVTQTGKSDYDEILRCFHDYPSEVELCIPRKNPPPRDRINSVNSFLAGKNRRVMKIDEDMAPLVIKDLASVEWNATGTDVMKITDTLNEKSLLTHASDGLGYRIYYDYPDVLITNHKEVIAQAARKPLVVPLREGLEI